MTARLPAVTVAQATHRLSRHIHRHRHRTLHRRQLTRDFQRIFRSKNDLLRFDYEEQSFRFEQSSFCNA